ncbi:MAG: hypothetical protein JOY90_02225 [Bradyrhizobium sp.]|uniref:hypothetical protein n=1 Tax=Bradyrhizobium sp. TaxID=376 RepID=UPI001D93BCEC|nr:hypothetical protein [Bradyrhizobium sp.]
MLLRFELDHCEEVPEHVQPMPPREIAKAAHRLGNEVRRLLRTSLARVFLDP